MCRNAANDSIFAKLWRACLTSLACSDILACDENAGGLRVSGSTVGQGNRREYFLSRSKSLHTTLGNILFVSCL